MALTVTDITRTVFGNRRAVLASITFDSSYATGGESLTAAMLGLSQVDAVLIEGVRAGRGVAYDKTNSKLLAYGDPTHTATIDTHTHTENTAGSYTQNATTGTTVATGSVSGAAGAALAEVASTTDLSAFSVIVLALGL